MLIIDNLNRIYEPVISGDNITIKKEDISIGTEYIEVQLGEWDATIGERGYYVVADAYKRGSQLCYFTEKAEEEYIVPQVLMPIFGVKNSQGCFLFIAEGMKATFHIRIGLKDRRYYIAGRFDLDEDVPYEDITFYVIDLGKDADYTEMAKYYRKYQLERGECVPLREKVKDSEWLKYAVEAPEIRIRMGWKPAPSEVKEQTIENEPEMKVACTFERVKDLIDELKLQGVDKAQLCLVGWNKSGHDGRWPQMFPVEEKFGGEVKLRELINYAQEHGYQIVCHTNCMDAYHIAEDFREDILIKKKDGSLDFEEAGWSGGRPYHICPKKSLEFTKRDLPKVADLGFKGIHYIDIMSVMPLRKCYDKNHPVNQADTDQLYKQIAKDCKELFGGFASEGANDFAASYLDYGLYVTYADNERTFFDKEIPLWQLVYHGIILSNPSTTTINYPIKGQRSYMKFIEYGGRPSFYLYSKFMSNSQVNWLGKEDLACGTDEELKDTVGYIKNAYEEYKSMRHLQYEFMDGHYEKEPGVHEVTYSDGTVVEVDYTNNKIKY